MQYTAKIKFVFPIGLPASGKSSWVREEMGPKDFCLSYDVYREWPQYKLEEGASPKDIEKREAAVKKQLRDDIQEIFTEAVDEIEACERANVEHTWNERRVFIDNTNLSSKALNRILEYLKTCAYRTAGRVGFTTEVNDSFLSVPVEECVIRDAARERSVGPSVIYHMYKTHVRRIEKAADHRTRLAYNEKLASHPITIKDDTYVIIVDLDGTLALMTDRGPYEGGVKYLRDAVNWPVYYMLEALTKENLRVNGRRIEIMFLSGREGTAYNVAFTSEWLKDNVIIPLGLHNPSNVFVPKWSLYLRHEGDHRSDDIVKEELFRGSHIGLKDDCKVLAVFDDRDRVVKMWREKMGFPVFQVAPGDF